MRTRRPDLGTRLRTLLGEYARAGGRDAALLLHAADAEPSLAALARRGRGLPARVLPVEVEHIASVGIDLWMAALAWGASGVAVLATGREAPQYREALRFQMSIAQTVANAQGYQGEHFRLIDAVTDDRRTRGVGMARRVAAAHSATFAATNDKRRTLALRSTISPSTRPCRARRSPCRRVRRSERSTWTSRRCTMCLACVGSCPEAALLDHAESPQLRFIETNCVQCGICASTCPEQAISLVPRLDLSPEARAPRVLNEAKIFACARCGKPMGTEKLVRRCSNGCAGTRCSPARTASRD